MATRAIDRAVFRAQKLVEAGGNQAAAINTAAGEFQVKPAEVAAYFKTYLTPLERGANRRPR